jgi:elongation factor Ts
MRFVLATVFGFVGFCAVVIFLYAPLMSWLMRKHTDVWIRDFDRKMGIAEGGSEFVNEIREAKEGIKMSTATEVKIDAKLVKELREKSGAPMGDCLKALQESKGEIEGAFVVLRKRGMASAAKKASRSTNEGAVGTYIHAGGKIGVLLELNCESDFVARTDDFQELLKDIAMHIAAVDPRYVGKDEVTQQDIDREKEIYRAQAAATGKPANIIEKMLEGKLGKFYEEFCLLEQPFIKDQAQSIAQLIASKVAKLGENISVRRFARFKIGDPNFTVATAKVSAEEAPQA